MTRIATLTNRYTEKTARLTVKVDDAGLLFVSKRQYDSALEKIGHGPFRSDCPFIVRRPSGESCAQVDEGNQ